MPQEKLPLVEFTAREMAQRLAQVRRKSCGASLSMPATAAATRTTSQRTFAVTPSPS